MIYFRTRFGTNLHLHGNQDDERLSLLDRLAGLDLDPRHDARHRGHQARRALLESAQSGEKLRFLRLELEPSFLVGEKMSVKASVLGFYDDATFILITL